MKSHLIQVDTHSSLTLTNADISFSSTSKYLTLIKIYYFFELGDNIPLVKCDSSQLTLKKVDIDGNLIQKSHFLEIADSFLTIDDSKFDSNSILGKGGNF